nr:RNA-directed DNA polymerase, eukaryota [Tanacetum cinerariifolium]
MVREEENVQVEVEGNDLKENNSDDPFNLYPLLNKKKNTEKSNNTESFHYPPGFTPCDVKAAGLDKNTTGINEFSGVGGLNPKAKKDWVKEICVSHKVNFLTLQETKIESITLFDVKCCWVNFAFDHVYSPAVGNSGGIFCVWEKSSFKKINSTVSDYFVMIRGTRVCSGFNLLIISVYAPQEFFEKKMLWDYLGQVIKKWNCEVIVMGDFNEVWYKNERYGSVFHAHGADALNIFISNANLQEIPLGGSAFTWCHRSASKMSKLDRFLMSEGLLSANPNFSAITLDRYLSDHRPIMLRESFHDYGPIPFRSFHYWFEIDGFEEMISKAWCESPAIEVNPMLKLMYKMKFLKKEFVSEMEIIKSIQEVDNTEAAQKAKIKWAIEEDENTKYYHGIVNKKRNQLAIRGVLKDGIWIENPNLVKIDMESDVSYQEIKRVVWDCGVDKSSRPDGFTFGFIRRFRSLLEKDIVAAVKYFLLSVPFLKDVKGVKEKQVLMADKSGEVGKHGNAYSIHSPHSVNGENMNDVGRNGVDVVVPVESIRAINEMFTNTAYGFFLGKRVAYPIVATYVRNTWGKYGRVKSMLNSSTASSYARAMIELRADVELKDTIMVAMPKLLGMGSIRVPFVLNMSGNLLGVR